MGHTYAGIDEVDHGVECSDLRPSGPMDRLGRPATALPVAHKARVVCLTS